MLKKSLVTVSFLLVFANSGFSQKQKYKYAINDAHCHFVDFVQNTDGMNVLFEKMDSAQVENVVLFGLSVTKLWTDFDRERPIYYNDNDAPVYYYSYTDVILAEAVEKLPKEQKDRVYPMICGFNPADRNGLDHVKRMVDMYPDLWVGIGEIFFRHDDLTRMTYGRNPTANCVSMEPIYKYAAEKNLPLWVHSDMTDPFSTKPTFLYEMVEAIDKHPETTFVWCHVGDTRGVNTIDNYVDTTRWLLNTYPNLYFDISWEVFEQIIYPDSTLSKDWVAILEDFPTRFMVGSDKIGRFSNYVKTIRRYDVLFDALTRSTAVKLASENMLDLLEKKNQRNR